MSHSTFFCDGCGWVLCNLRRMLDHGSVEHVAIIACHITCLLFVRRTHAMLSATVAFMPCSACSRSCCGDAAVPIRYHVAANSTLHSCTIVVGQMGCRYHAGNARHPKIDVVVTNLQQRCGKNGWTSQQVAGWPVHLHDVTRGTPPHGRAEFRTQHTCPTALCLLRIAGCACECDATGERSTPLTPGLRQD